jgi:DNA-binding winged helix-turn-helix (wHTH) protein/TolB-like protein
MNGRVRFGRFEFDPGTGVLLRDGFPVRLQPQPGRVLGLLVERAGEVVTRDELRQTVWADGTFVDFERGLNFCIAQIRAALGDAADSPRFVETLPRRGYRFIAPCSRVEPAQPAAAAGAGTASEAGTRPGPAAGRPRASLRWILAASVLVTLIGALLLFLRPAAPVRVAVVPFDNETGSGAYENVAGGVADATVARLATPDRLARVSVIGNAAVLRRPRGFRDLKAIGEELDAQYVVLAQVKRDSGKVRLIAHLIRVRDEAHVWAHQFDRPAFTLDVQSEIAEAIAAAVTEKVAG